MYDKIKIFRNICIILMLSITCAGCIEYLHIQGKIWNLTLESNETPGFRNMSFQESSFEKIAAISKKEGIPFSKLLAVWMPKYQFSLGTVQEHELTLEDYQVWKSLYGGSAKNAIERIEKSYEAIWDDLVYYPVPDSVQTEVVQTTYENSWMAERNYGGTRGHEGTDLMPVKNVREIYPVISMSKGTIENIGWLKKGGYRIGIRAPHGGYFYYAHLSSYAKQFKEGDQVQAGELLGYMGDTGYSEIEGTTGNFDVHLHLGIYIRTANHEEISVNPYWVLRYLESHKLKYVYKM